VFGPVIDSNCRVLILGSFPSVQSRKEAFYYMHPANRFWRVLSLLLNIDLTPLDCAGKTRVLLENHIALYDVVESCTIVGSADSSIQNVVFAKIQEIIQFAPIKHIFLNGTKAFALFINHFPELSSMASLLPSTSAANAKTSLQNLVEKWYPILLK
jgi:hypoxanthine-DNA glycosylase